MCLLTVADATVAAFRDMHECLHPLFTAEHKCCLAGLEVDSGVPDQPFGDAETRRG